MAHKPGAIMREGRPDWRNRNPVARLALCTGAAFTTPVSRLRQKQVWHVDIRAPERYVVDANFGSEFILPRQENAGQSVGDATTR